MTSNIQRQDTAMGVIWILNTDDIERFKFCKTCQKEFEDGDKKSFCPAKEAVFCHLCDLKECVMPNQNEHPHFFISYIQSVQKSVDKRKNIQGGQ